MVLLLATMVVLEVASMRHLSVTYDEPRHFLYGQNILQWMQRHVAWVGRIPLPLPYPYVEGLDWVVQRERTGEGYGNIRRSTCWPGIWWGKDAGRLDEPPGPS